VPWGSSSFPKRVLRIREDYFTRTTAGITGNLSLSGHGFTIAK
jgi:hypothetical protein